MASEATLSELLEKSVSADVRTLLAAKEKSRTAIVEYNSHFVKIFRMLCTELLSYFG